MCETNPHKMTQCCAVVVALDLSVPGHAGGWESWFCEQVGDRSELRGTRPGCAQGETTRMRKHEECKKYSLAFISQYLTTTFLLSCPTVQHWKQRSRQSSCHLDWHRHPLQGVGHPSQRHLVRQEGASIFFLNSSLSSPSSAVSAQEPVTLTVASPTPD